MKLSPGKLMIAVTFLAAFVLWASVAFVSVPTLAQKGGRRPILILTENGQVVVKIVGPKGANDVSVFWGGPGVPEGGGYGYWTKNGKEMPKSRFQFGSNINDIHFSPTGRVPRLPPIPAPSGANDVEIRWDEDGRITEAWWTRDGQRLDRIALSNDAQEISLQFNLIAKPTPKVEIDPEYKFEFKTSPGLNTETFILPSGSKISVNLPDDMSAGDTITGTVRTEVAGKDEKQRAKNQAELEKIQLQIGGQSMPATGKMFTRSLAANLDVKLDERFILLAVNGKQVCSVAVPLTQNPPPAPQIPQLPTCGQMGRNVVVRDHCDGIIAPTDSCSIGGTQLQPLAESPRLRVMQNTSEVPGLTEIKYSEQGKEVSGPFQNLGVKLTSPNTNLLRGQKTTLDVVASVQGIQQDVSLDLVNDTPGIVSISGGDNQHFTIHPADVQADGTYHQNFTVTANQAGAWGATATVSCVGPIAGGPARPQPGSRNPLALHKYPEGLGLCSGSCPTPKPVQAGLGEEISCTGGATTCPAPCQCHLLRAKKNTNDDYEVVPMPATGKPAYDKDYDYFCLCAP